MSGEKIINNLANRIIELNYEAANTTRNLEADDDIVNFDADDIASRFVNVEETKSIVEEQKNVNTKKQTECHLRLFRQFLRQKKEFREPQSISPTELDTYLAQFFLSVRKTSEDKQLGDIDRQYEPSSLVAMHSSIFRYLRDLKYECNIKQDMRFQHSRNVLSAKLKELKQLGKGNNPNAAQSFAPEELDVLVNKNVLGTSKFVTYVQLK